MTGGRLFVHKLARSRKKAVNFMPNVRSLSFISWVRARALLVDLLLWAVLCALLSVAFTNINAVTERYPGISLRFNKQLSGQSAYAAREYSIKHSGDEAFWPTFWQEEALSIVNEYAKIETNGLFFSGDANLVWPAEYIAGAAPGVTDRTGCALSSSLAWRLWGGVDVVGKTVEINEITYTVRGVFEGEDALALVSTGEENVSQSFFAAELAGGPVDATRDDIENYSIACGLGKPDAILKGAPAFIARLMAIIPLLLMACYVAGMLIGWLWKSHRIIRQMILFALLLGFAALLPTLLDAMPDWLIPGSWSDFSFWESLLRQVNDNVMEFFHMTPRIRDAEGKMLLLLQACIAYASSLCAMLICFKWHLTQKNKSADIAERNAEKNMKAYSGEEDG